MCRPAIATAPSTCSCASSARSSTAAPASPTCTRTTASAIASAPSYGAPTRRNLRVMRPDLTAPYLTRLGVDGRPPPTAEALALLHRAHLERVPFENLDIHLGVPIELDEVAFAEKVALRSRGGFCYELNGAFASLLGELGFEVDLLEASVFSPRGLRSSFDHLCLRVRTGEVEWLADIGFGRRCLVEPIQLVPEVAQTDSAGSFVLQPGPGGSLDLLCDGVKQYRLTHPSRALADFEPGCRCHQSSPDSPFTRGTVCTIRTA